MSLDEPTPIRAALGPRTGMVVGGRYKLVAPLAEGGMGSVWRAEHETLGHAVAVKFLAFRTRSTSASATIGGTTQHDTMRARFEKEARLAAKIAEDSRHVVKVTDHGVADDGTPWLVMELLHGEALDKILRREGKLSLDRATKIVRQVARGLEVAHRHGVVHRDLKPANVFVCHDLDTADFPNSSPPPEHEDATSLDFGVAKSLWEDEDAPTRENVVLGTPGYMSPEQIAGEAGIDVRTDVWALGAIAYRMIVGKPPFGVGTTAEIAARIQATDPTPPSQIVAGVPEEIDAVFERALAKDVDERFPTARDLADALSRAAGLAIPPADHVASTNDGAVVDPRENKPISHPPPSAPLPAADGDRRRRRYVVGALLLVLLILVVFVRGRSETPRRAATSSSPTPSSARSDAPTSATAGVTPSPSAPLGASVSASITASASASTSASASAIVPRKVVDTWNKKDEL